MTTVLEEIGRVLFDPTDDENPIMIDVDGFMSIKAAQSLIADIRRAIKKAKNARDKEQL